MDTWSPCCDTRWMSVAICASAFTKMYIYTICCKWFLLSLIHPSPCSMKLSLIHNIIRSVKLGMYSHLMTNPTEWKLWHWLSHQQAAQEEVQEYTVDCSWLKCLSSGIKSLRMKLWNVKSCNFS
jgi:hypothetical protein